MTECGKCFKELTYLDGELRCPECGRIWNEIILEDKLFFDDELLQSFNALFAYEYSKLKLFIQDKQVYGALLQIKDIYEVLMKFPVLVSASYFFHFKKDEDKNTFLVNLVNQKNSMGNWLDHLCIVKKKLKKEESMRVLYEIAEKTVAFCNDNNVVAWRNKNIGHGATKTLDDGNMYDDLFERIKSVTSFFKETENLYKQIKMFIKGKERLTSFSYVKGMSGTPFADVNGTEIQLDPFFYLVDGGLYFYDNYFPKKSYLDIVDYPRGKRDMKATHVFDDLRDDYVYQSSLQDDVISLAEIEISNNVLNISDFVEPSFIKQWICDRIDDDDQIFMLRMQKGMGKSTLVRALDPFQMNKISLPDTAVRTYYINPTYGSKVYSFASEVYRQLSHDDNNAEFHGNFHYIQEECPDPKREFAEALNHAKRQPHFRGRNLLFILDGIDELNPQAKRNITDFIPDPDMLDDGIYIMLTSRTLLDDDAVIYSIRTLIQKLGKYPSLELYVGDEKYKELKKKYFQNHIITPLKDLCKRKKVEFLFTEGQRDSFLKDIENDNFLYLRQLKELSMIKASNLIDQGASIISCENVLLSKTDTLLDEYFSSLKNNYGEKYFRQFSRIMVTFTIIDDYLTIEDLSYLVVNGSMSLSFLGFINTIRMFLAVKRTNNGNSYKISHTENVRYIREHMNAEILAMADELLNKVRFILKDGGVDYLDKFDMTFLPYFVNVARTFNKLGESSKYAQCLQIADKLFRDCTLEDIGDNIDDLLISRNILYRQSLLNYGEKHCIMSLKDNILAMARNHIACADFHFAQRDNVACIDHYDKAFKLLAKTRLTDSEKDSFYFMHEPVFIFMLAERGTYEDIIKYADYADSIFNEMQKRGYPFSPTSLSHHAIIRGYYLQMTNRWEEALAYELEAVEYLKDYKTTKEKWNYASRLSDAGKNYAHLLRFEEALNCLLEADRLYAECMKEGYFQYVKNIWFTHRRLFDCYQRMGNYKDAISHAETAIGYLEEKERMNLLSNRIFIINAYYDLANLYYLKGDYIPCLNYLQTALDKYNNLDTFQQNKILGINMRKKIADLYSELQQKGVYNGKDSEAV